MGCFTCHSVHQKFQTFFIDVNSTSSSKFLGTLSNKFMGCFTFHSVHQQFQTFCIDVNSTSLQDFFHVCLVGCLFPRQDGHQISSQIFCSHDGNTGDRCADNPISRATGLS